MKRAGRGRRLLHRLWEYACLHLGLHFLGLICLSWTPLAVLLAPLLPARWGRPLGRYVIMAGFRLYLGFLGRLGACRFDLSALDGLRQQGPMILAPNHPCLLDAVMVISRLPNVACIMKASLMNNLFLGAGARLARYIRNDAALGMVKAAVAELQQGAQLLIFPEGTRTTAWPFNGCHGSLGLIATRAGVPVQTLIIETDSAYLSKGWPLFRRPAMPIHYRVRLGQRFLPGADKAPVLMANLDTWFRHNLENAELPRSTTDDHS